MSDIVTCLSRFIADQTGYPAEVAEMERMPGGFSYETWSLRATWRDGAGHKTARLILRKAPRGGVLEPYDASKEFRILRALEGTAVPAPRALWLEPTGAVLGASFYLMEFVAGEIPLPWDTSIAPATRAEMHRQFADTLAELHTLDWEALGLDFLGVPAERADPAALEIYRCEQTLARVALRPYPVLQEVMLWLHERRPVAPRLSFVHDDFRMGNFVWRQGRIVAFLDWERAFLGDPMSDVAFTRLENLAGWCNISGEMGQRYSARSGIAVDEVRVGYYIILELLKATLVGLSGLKALADGRTSDLRLVQIGRGAHHGIKILGEMIGLGK